MMTSCPFRRLREWCGGGGVDGDVCAEIGGDGMGEDGRWSVLQYDYQRCLG